MSTTPRYDAMTYESGIRAMTATEANMLQKIIDVTAERDALRTKSQRQRVELRRLNRALAAYWRGFSRGLAVEEVCRLRGAMIAAFGAEAVRKAEHSAVDAAIKREENE